MKYFSKLIFGLLAIICCNSNGVIASSNPANNPAIENDNTNNTADINETIDQLVNNNNVIANSDPANNPAIENGNNSNTNNTADVNEIIDQLVSNISLYKLIWMFMIELMH